MKTQTLRLGACAALLASVAQILPAQDITALDPIVIEAQRQAELLRNRASGSTQIPQQSLAAPMADGGALISTLPGVDFNRMGGHGVDLVIRGQQANQLTVIDSGSLTYGACPNRMDPPSSTLSILRADRIIVDRGYASVTNGAGGTGGTVRLERDTPEFADARRWTGTLAAGANSNGNGYETAGTFAYDLGGGFFIEGSAEVKGADNYTDGAGREERSAYDQRSTGLTFGYDDGTLDLAFDIERDLAEDVLFAGAGMDSPFSETDVYRLRGGIDLNMGVLTRIEGSLYSSAVDHVMDNFTLRPNAGTRMRVPSTSDTIGGRIEAQLAFGATTAKIGLDHQANDKLAIAYGGGAPLLPQILASDPAVARFVMWPDVTIAQTGLFAETETALSQSTTLKLGLRYDHVRASAGLAGGLAGAPAPTPNSLYTLRYGTTFDAARHEDNFGALARIEHQITPDLMVFAGLSTSARTADATERAMARSEWVGNPDIAPEQHNQFDLGVEAAGNTWALNATAWVDKVDDYILRDQFSVAGVSTYRNVSALLAGVELSGSWARDGWVVNGDLAWTWGDNRSDNRPLAQIPPLQGSLSLARDQGLWQAGGRVNFATAQNRIDPSRDPGATAGYATLDLFGSYDLSEKAVLIAGVDNVFDKQYARHLSRSNTFDTSVTRVAEPGRSLYLKVEARF